MSNPSPISAKRKAQLYKSRPPLNDQITNLKMYASNIYKFLDPNDSEQDGNYIEATEAFNESLEKMIHDIWCEYRFAQKANVGEISSKAKKLLEEQLGICGVYSSEFYASFEAYLNMIFSDKLLCALSKTILPATVEFLETYTDVMLTSLTQLINQAEKTQNDHLIPPLRNQSLNWLKNTIDSVFKSHEYFMELSKEILDASDNYEPPPMPELDSEIAKKGESELTPQEKDRIKKINLEITEYEQNKLIHNKRFDAQKKAISILKEFFNKQTVVLFDYVLNLYKSLPEVMPKEDEGKGEEIENESKEINDNAEDYGYIQLLRDYSAHLERIEDLYPIADDNVSSGSGYDQISEAKIESSVEPFIKDAYRNASMVLYKYIIQFWKTASNRKSYGAVIEIGEIAGDYAQNELELEDEGLSSLKISNVAQLYSYAVRAEDTVTAEDLGKMLVVRIQRAEDDLVLKFQEQIKKLESGVSEEQIDDDLSSLPPPDSAEDFQSVASNSQSVSARSAISTESKSKEGKEQCLKRARQEARSKVAKKHSDDVFIKRFNQECAKLEKEIDEIVNDGCEAIFTARAAFDILNPPPENESDEEVPNIFQESLNSFIISLYDQQSILNRMLGEPPKSAKSKAKESSAKSVSKATSVKTANNRKNYENVRIDRIRDANLNLYEYIIITMRNRLIYDSRNASIFDNDKERSELVNGLKKYTIKYKKLVGEARSAAAKSLHFDAMEAYDARLSKIETTPDQLIQSFENSLSSALDIIVENYEVALIHADEDFLYNKEECESKLVEMFDEKRKVHLEQLVLLEKRLFIKRNIDEQRPVTAAQDLREEAKKLAAARDYEGARAKQQAAIEAEEEEIANRDLMIKEREEKEYKALEAKQASEINLLEQMVERWIDKARKEADEVKTNARDAVEPSMRTAVKRTVDAALEAVNSICKPATPDSKKVTSEVRKVTPRKGSSKESIGYTRPLLQSRFERLAKEKLDALVLKEKENEKENKKE